jgi:hypothetical protein
VILTFSVLICVGFSEIGLYDKLTEKFTLGLFSYDELGSIFAEIAFLSDTRSSCPERLPP